MKATLALLFLSWASKPAGAAVLDTDVHTEVGNWTESGNEIQNYTRTAEGACQLSTCEFLLGELASLKSKVLSMESELQASRNEIEQLKRANTEKVAFSASIGGYGHTGPYNVAKTLEYKNVFTNIGNAYSPATGVFVAPVRGIYYFNFCYHAGQKGRAEISLYKNGQLIASTSHHRWNGGTTENGSNGVALQLEVGDHVNVILHAEAWVWDGPRHDTVFTGFLVTPV